jgi:hypothetical protein
LVTPLQAQEGTDRETLLARIQRLEERLAVLEGRAEPEPADRTGPAQAVAGAVDTDLSRALLARLDDLEQRLSSLESTAVLSEPETRVRQVEVWVDDSGAEYDHPVEGAKRTFTYQRERVYRRQTINEKIEEALAGQEGSRVQIGVDAASTIQFAERTKGDNTQADGNAYSLASADLFFTARLAQNTLFFADVVGLSGPSPDEEIEPITLLNAYTARLSLQTELNLREAWLRTEFFEQKLALSFGRLDLTNYFDENAAANDETIQFISDALVNNPALGLSSNGPGLVAVFDPKSGLDFKVGMQQSDPEATSLSEAIFTLAEVGYVARPFDLPEGKYRLWYRRDDGSDENRDAFGVSIDQKLTPIVTLFARYGSAEADIGRDHFYSGGFQFRNGWVINPLDVWGIGYAYADLGTGESEHLAEGYYAVHLAERLRLSLHLQHVIESKPAMEDVGYLLPGLRLQASF